MESEGKRSEVVIISTSDISEVLQGRYILFGDELADGGVGGQAGEPEAGDAHSASLLGLV